MNTLWFHSLIKFVNPHHNSIAGQMQPTKGRLLSHRRQFQVCAITRRRKVKCCNSSSDKEIGRIGLYIHQRSYQCGETKFQLCCCQD